MRRPAPSRRWAWLGLLALACAVIACARSGRELPSRWRGHIESKSPVAIAGAARRYDFVLVFERFEEGRVEGKMTWPDGAGPGVSVTRAVQGTYGERMLLVDADRDQKDVLIAGARMTGTDKAGAWILDADADAAAPVLVEKLSASSSSSLGVSWILATLVGLTALAFASRLLGQASDRTQWRGTLAIAALGAAASIAAAVGSTRAAPAAAPLTIAARWRGKLVGAPDYRKHYDGPVCVDFVLTFGSFRDGQATGRLEWPECSSSSDVTGLRDGAVLRFDARAQGVGVVRGDSLSGRTPQGWQLVADPEPGAPALTEELSPEAAAARAVPTGGRIVSGALALVALFAGVASAAALARAARWFGPSGLSTWAPGNAEAGRVTSADGEAFEATGVADGPVIFRPPADRAESYRRALRAIVDVVPGAWFDVRKVYERRLFAARALAIAAIVASLAGRAAGG